MKIAIIGGGPGGYEAAIYAAKKGAEVVLIEKNRVGGTCLHMGCIPTKALLASGEAVQVIRKAFTYGIHLDTETSIDYASIAARKDKVVAGLAKGVQHTLASNGVKVIAGIGRLKNASTVAVELLDGGSEKIMADAILLATGSVPVFPNFVPVDEKHILTSNGILSLTHNPASITILGGGVIGCEIGQFLARMGSKVNIVELLPHVVAAEDEDVSETLEKQFRRDKIRLYCGKHVTKVANTDSSVQAYLDDGTILETEALMVSVGRSPFTDGLGLEQVGIQTDHKGFVMVDQVMRTSIPGIYAIGDMINSLQLAHVATKEGMCAVDTIMGIQSKVNYAAVPRCVYTEPEIASVGVTERELRVANVSYSVGQSEFVANGKAKAAGKTVGFIKVLADQDGIILGATIVGAHATEIIATLTLAVDIKLTVKQVGNLIFPHPTMSEGIMKAVHDIQLPA